MNEQIAKKMTQTKTKGKAASAVDAPCYTAIDAGDIEIARTLMREIQYDIDAINCYEKERFPKKWLTKIAKAAKPFFDANPQHLNNDSIFEICCGEESENKEKYGKLQGWMELDKVLDEYFEAV